MPSFREKAFLVCRDRAGELHAGNVVTGNTYDVEFPTHCPTGTTPYGVMHTHPPTRSQGQETPSEADYRETKARGLAFVCVGHKGKVRCFPV